MKRTMGAACVEWTMRQRTARITLPMLGWSPTRNRESGRCQNGMRGGKVYLMSILSGHLKSHLIPELAAACPMTRSCEIAILRMADPEPFGRQF